jgi:MFS family permease
MAEPHDPYAALRVPDYRRLLTSTLLGNIATRIQDAAVGWELYQRTDSATALGFLGLAQFLPVLLLSLPAGHAADRFSRKALVSGSLVLTILSSIGLAAISYTDGPVPLMYLCVGLVGLARAVSGSARSALLSSVVPEELLASAATWNSSMMQIALVGGPALGGLGVWLAGKDIYLVYVSATFCVLASAAFLYLVHPRPLEHRPQKVTLHSLFAGIRFVFNSELILATITLDLFAVLLAGPIALLPIFTKDILHVDAFWFGWLKAAPSLGSLLIAAILAHRPPLRRAGPALLWSVVGFGATTIAFGLSRNPYLSFALLALTGVFDYVSVVVRATLVQVLTPDEMRGRVAAVNVIFIESSNKLGEFESGITASWFGTVESVVVGGIGAILVVLGVMYRWPQLTRLGSLASITPAPGIVADMEAAESIGATEDPLPLEAGPAVKEAPPP